MIPDGLVLRHHFAVDDVRLSHLHATPFLLDTVVAPHRQRCGLGARLVAALVEDVRAAGCAWLHVDFEPHLQGFYAGCGFRPTDAGLLRLT